MARHVLDLVRTFEHSAQRLAHTSSARPDLERLDRLAIEPVTRRRERLLRRADDDGAMRPSASATSVTSGLSNEDEPSFDSVTSGDVSPVKGSHGGFSWFPVQESEQAAVHGQVKGSVQELGQVSEQELGQVSEQELGQVSEQELSQAPEQELDKAPDQELDKAPDQELDKAPDQELDKASDQELGQALSDQELGQAPEQELSQAPEQELDKAPEQELDKASEEESVQMMDAHADASVRNADSERADVSSEDGPPVPERPSTDALFAALLQRMDLEPHIKERMLHLPPALKVNMLSTAADLFHAERSTAGRTDGAPHGVATARTPGEQNRRGAYLDRIMTGARQVASSASALSSTSAGATSTLFGRLRKNLLRRDSIDSSDPTEWALWLMQRNESGGAVSSESYMRLAHLVTTLPWLSQFDTMGGVEALLVRLDQEPSTAIVAPVLAIADSGVGLDIVAAYAPAPLAQLVRRVYADTLDLATCTRILDLARLYLGRPALHMSQDYWDMPFRDVVALHTARRLDPSRHVHHLPTHAFVATLMMNPGLSTPYEVVAPRSTIMLYSSWVLSMLQVAADFPSLFVRDTGGEKGSKEKEVSGTCDMDRGDMDRGDMDQGDMDQGGNEEEEHGVHGDPARVPSTSADTFQFTAPGSPEGDALAYAEAHMDLLIALVETSHAPRRLHEHLINSGLDKALLMYRCASHAGLLGRVGRYVTLLGDAGCVPESLRYV